MMTTVEMACLKINCSWLLVSRMSEYLSKLLMRPESFTPLSRYSVIAVLSLRALLRKLSWIFCAGLSIVSPIYRVGKEPQLGAFRLIVHPNAQRYTRPYVTQPLELACSKGRSNGPPAARNC